MLKNEPLLSLTEIAADDLEETYQSQMKRDNDKNLQK